ARGARHDDVAVGGDRRVYGSAVGARYRRGRADGARRRAVERVSRGRGAAVVRPAGGLVERTPYRRRVLPRACRPGRMTRPPTPAARLAACAPLPCPPSQAIE